MRGKLLALAVSATLGLGIGAAAAQTPPPPRIVVSGDGEASVAPDIALLSLTVMREAKTAREALVADNTAMQAVIDALKALGIAERDLQTAGIQIVPRYDYRNKPDGTQEAELAAYQVMNTLTVRVRDIAKSGEILDRAVSLGVNQGGGISFINDDPASAFTEARREAVADALAKARTLAEAAGVQVGRILEISEQGGIQSPVPIEAKAFDARAAVPIQPGENAYRVQVSVTFEIR